MDKFLKYQKSAAIVLAALIIGGAIVYVNYMKAGIVQGAISGEEAAKKAVSYINEQFLKDQTKAEGQFVSEESGVYKMSIKVNGQASDSYITKDGRILMPIGYPIGQAVAPSPAATTDSGKTVGNFSVSTDAVCMEDGKPIVYFFGSNTCPHCKWEHPVVTKVIKNFEGLVSFHDNLDATDKDKEIFSKYSTGGVPTLVFGCKYYRVGSGSSFGEETEIKNITAILCKLTGGNPSSECSKVQDLIGQIGE
jgi:thiol-disulfide isomerase/thioredoxin